MLLLVAPGVASAATTTVQGSTMTVLLGDAGSFNATVSGRNGNVFTPLAGTAGNAGLIIAFDSSALNSDGYQLPGSVYGFAGQQNPFTPLGGGVPEVVTGKGTEASPFTVVSRFNVTSISLGVNDPALTRSGWAARRGIFGLGGGGLPVQLEITQTTRHVSGTNQFSTTWAIKNVSGAPRTFRAFAAAEFNFGVAPGEANLPIGRLLPGPPPVLQSSTPGNSGLVAALQANPAFPWDHVQAGLTADVFSNNTDPQGSGYTDKVHDVEGLEGDTALGAQWSAHADGDNALAPGATYTIGLTWRFASPVAGRTVTGQPAGGTVLVTRPGSSRPVALRTGDAIPMGSVVDTRSGTVNIQAAGASPGSSQFAQLRYGIFKLSQDRKTAVTDLTLVGALEGCPKKKARRSARASARRSTGRRVWGRGKGKFRTSGRRGAGSVRGTTWQVTDRCDGSTLIQSIEGSVAATDFGKRRFTKLLRTGQSYVARPASSKRGRGR